MQRFFLHATDHNRGIIHANLLRFLDALSRDKSWEIHIREWRPARTSKQRRSLFGVAYQTIMRETGLQGSRDKDRLHEQMCGEFFGWKDGPMGTRVPVRTTTKNEHGERDEIDTVTALEMYGFIQRLAAEYGVDVPDPDPFWREKLREAA